MLQQLQPQVALALLEQANAVGCWHMLATPGPLALPAHLGPQGPWPHQVEQPALSQPRQSWRRLQSRRDATVFYYWNPNTGETRAEPPPPWQKVAKSDGQEYYFNGETMQASWEKPDF